MTVIGHGYDDNVGAPAFRNVIINGNMSVAQRNTSVASITADGYYTVDRFSTRNITLGTWTQSVENDAPTGSGHRKSLKMLCTAAKASPSAGDGLWIRHKIEGQNLQHFAKGTSSAKSFSLQFWVKSNVTGTYTIALYDNDNNRHIGASYTISASATWEKKTVVFAADTSGAFDNDNLDSLWVDFGLGAGSSWTSGSIPSSWGSYSGTNYAVGQSNVAATVGNYWQVTGVQLEAGTIATPFEFEPFETTLRKCQRYYQKTDYFQGTAGNPGNLVVVVPAFFEMRTTITPSIAGTTWDISDNYVADHTAASPTMPNIYAAGSRNVRLNLGGFTGLTSGRYYNSRPSTTSLVGLSAEL